MTNDERASLEVLRAEVNGKLDLIIERIQNLKEDAGESKERINSLSGSLDDLRKQVYIGAGIIATVALIVGALIQGGYIK